MALLHSILVRLIRPDASPVAATVDLARQCKERGTGGIRVGCEDHQADFIRRQVIIDQAHPGDELRLPRTPRADARCPRGECDRVRIVYWDRNGYAMWTKRLEKGRFHPTFSSDKRLSLVAIEAAELALTVEGIELAGPEGVKAAPSGEPRPIPSPRRRRTNPAGESTVSAG
jgi:IS66 Orf2 like protein